MAKPAITFHDNGYPRYVSVSRISKFGLKAPTRLLLEKLVQKCTKHAKDNGGEVQINYKKLAHDVGMSLRTVQRHVSVLRDKELILMSHVFSPSGTSEESQEGNLFKLNLEHFFFNPTEEELAKLRDASRLPNSAKGRVFKRIPPCQFDTPPHVNLAHQKTIKTLEPLEAIKSKTESASSVQIVINLQEGENLMASVSEILKKHEGKKAELPTLESKGGKVTPTALSELWRKLLPQLYDELKMLPPFSGKDWGLIKTFQKAMDADKSLDPYQVLRFILENWDSFVEFGGLLDGQLWKYKQAKVPTLVTLSALSAYAPSFYLDKAEKKATPQKQKKTALADLPKSPASVTVISKDKPMTLEELNALMEGDDDE